MKSRKTSSRRTSSRGGGSSSNKSLGQKESFRLPVFKLPAIDLNQYNLGASDDANERERTFTLCSSVRDPLFVPEFKSLRDFVAAAGTLPSKSMSPTEFKFLKNYLRFKDQDVASVELILSIKYDVRGANALQLQSAQNLSSHDGSSVIACARQALCFVPSNSPTIQTPHTHAVDDSSRNLQLQMDFSSPHSYSKGDSDMKFVANAPHSQTVGHRRSPVRKTASNYNQSGFTLPTADMTMMQSSVTLKSALTTQSTVMTAQSDDSLSGEGNVYALSASDMSKLFARPKSRGNTLSGSPRKKGLHRSESSVSPYFSSLYTLEKGRPKSPTKSPRKNRALTSRSTNTMSPSERAPRISINTSPMLHSQSTSILPSATSLGVGPMQMKTFSPTATAQTPSSSSPTLPAIDCKNPMNRSMLLKTELMQSLGSIHKHTISVKKDMIAGQDFMGMKSKRTKDFMYGMGCDMLFATLNRYLLRRKKLGWHAWQLFMQVGIAEHKMAAYVKFHGARYLSGGLNNLVTRVIMRKYMIWVDYTKRELRRIQDEREWAASVQIQRIARGYIARQDYIAAQKVAKFQKLYEATIKIQAVIRGRLARWRYLKIKQEMREEAAAATMQRVFRGHQGRKRARYFAEQRRRKLAAIRIQAKVRQRQAYMKTQRLIQDRKEYRAASKIQAHVRGMLCRRHVIEEADMREKDEAAIEIQRVIRGALVRMNLEKIKKETFEFRKERNEAATKIQAVYRGYRDYLKARIMSLEVNREKRKKAKAATKINNCVRCFIARARRRHLVEERMKGWITTANAWKEMWSEESAMWFYLDERTGEASWEPPKGGYTKEDGKLVLANGEIIENPLYKKRNAIIDGEGATEDLFVQRNKCSECSMRFAIRMCKDCGDKFCTKCFKALHATGARRDHHWEKTALIDCQECEDKLAEYWCVACDEAYCDGCWRKVHSKGKRRFHPFSHVTTEGRIDKRIMTMDGEEVAGYDATYSGLKQENETDAYNATVPAITEEPYDYSEYPQEVYSQEITGGEGADQAEEWTMYYADDGTPYWYNNYTYASQYEDPYAATY